MATLGYWNIQGLAEPIRLLLAYLKIEYSNKFYETDQQEWFTQDKTSLGINFANLPYYIDGDIKIVQSSAIPIYIIKKNNRHELLGQNQDGSFNELEIRVQELQGVVSDLKAPLIRICFNPDFEKLKDATLTEKIAPLLKKISDFIGQKEFLLGNITYADFTLYDTLILIKSLYPQSINDKILVDYIQRFENIEGIKQYLATPHSYDKIFFHQKYAVWAGPNSN